MRASLEEGTATPTFRLLPREPRDEEPAPRWKRALVLARDRSRKHNPDETKLIERTFELLLGLARPRETTGAWSLK